jgi:hypothetical protein
MRILKSLLMGAAAAALFSCVSRYKDYPIKLGGFIEAGKVMDYFYDTEKQTLYLHLKRSSSSFIQKENENIFKYAPNKIYFTSKVDDKTKTITIYSFYPENRFDLYSSSDKDTGETKMLIGPLKPGEYNLVTFDRNANEESIEVNKKLILGDDNV